VQEEAVRFGLVGLLQNAQRGGAAMMQKDFEGLRNAAGDCPADYETSSTNALGLLVQYSVASKTTTYVLL
jgi:hypothetical protein